MSKKPTRSLRFEEIAKRFENYDIICLQEVWLKSDRDILKEYAQKMGLIYSHVYNSGILGKSGLVLISKWKIEQTFFHRYRVNGRFIRIDHGDYHAGKGIGYARIRLPFDRVLNLFITHTIAQYSIFDDYQPDRMSQVWELANFCKITNDPNAVVIVCGDLNSTPDSEEMKLFKHITGYTDTFEDKNTVIIGLDNELLNTHLDSGVDNKWKRLDYILYRKADFLKLVRSYIDYKHTNGIYYSDHFGIFAEFQLKDISPDHQSSPNFIQQQQDSFPKLNKEVVELARKIVADGILVATKRRWHLSNHMRVTFLLILIYICFASSSSYLIFRILFWPLIIYFFYEVITSYIVEKDEIQSLEEVMKEMNVQIAN